MISLLAYNWETVNERSLAIARLETKIAALLKLRYKDNEKIFSEIEAYLKE